MSPLKIWIFLVLSLCGTAKTFEIFSAGIIVGGTLFGTALYSWWQNIKCEFVECCKFPWIKGDLRGLQESLKQHVFGQHILKDELVRALRGHLMNSKPRKALALSFHGWTGSGKNYVSKFVAESLYKNGFNSQYVHLYISTLHFPNKNNITPYKMQIQNSIRESIRNCKRSLFIFDEIDKMPEGVMDSIKPFIDFYENIDGLDYRYAVFIFLSNTGGREITKKMLEFWKQGYQREDITYKDLEDLIHIGAFNEKGLSDLCRDMFELASDVHTRGHCYKLQVKRASLLGGLHHSSLLERSLIDVYIPFLPLERQHVKNCAALEMRKHDVKETEEKLNKIADQMSYWPADFKLYSTVGCKRVVQKVNEMVVDSEYDSIFGEKSEL